MSNTSHRLSLIFNSDAGDAEDADDFKLRSERPIFISLGVFVDSAALPSFPSRNIWFW